MRNIFGLYKPLFVGLPAPGRPKLIVRGAPNKTKTKQCGEWRLFLLSFFASKHGCDGEKGKADEGKMVVSGLTRCVFGMFRNTTDAAAAAG